MKQISIIIPTYNRAQSIHLTIDSFLKQSYPAKSYEIIVSDNNSTDSTKDTIKEFMDENPGRIKYIIEPMQGVHYARNSAAKVATGDILYFTASLDTQDPKKRFKAVKCIQKTSKKLSVAKKVYRLSRLKYNLKKSRIGSSIIIA